MTDRATGSDVTRRGSLGCAHAQLGFPRIFLTIVVPLRVTDRATRSDVTPNGVPSDAHMRNRKLGVGFPPFFSFFFLFSLFFSYMFKKLFISIYMHSTFLTPLGPLFLLCNSDQQQKHRLCRGLSHEHSYQVYC